MDSRLRGASESQPKGEMMREHPNDIGFIAAGTNAAEMARRFLHPELEGPHAGGSALPTLTGARPAIPSAIEWETQDEKEAKERLAQKEKELLATQATSHAIAADARPSLEVAQLTTRQLCVAAFQVYLWANLLFEIAKVVYWVDAASKSVDFLTSFSIFVAEIFRWSSNCLMTMVVLAMLWCRRPRALDAAIVFLSLRVAVSLSLAAYYESLRRMPLTYAEAWEPSAIVAVFWIPCLLSLRGYWQSWSPSKTSMASTDIKVTGDQVPQAATVRISWQVVTLLCVAMICGTAFAIAWCCLRR